MTATAVKKKSTLSIPAEFNGVKPEPLKPDYKMIPRKDLEPSATNPRRRFVEDSLSSLADSIRTQGILEPLIVRKADKRFEIVCGERRFRAAEMAGATELPCLIRDLSDEQVLDIQIHENLHREDVHPMDEALGYQFLKEKLGCDVKELSLRVGKSEGYVANRLKLNLLIQDAQKDIDEGYLPLTYALEIAKYSPEIQQAIYGEVYRKTGAYVKNEYVLSQNKETPIPFAALLEWINTNVHRVIAKAPFDPKATNLRPDGLACIKCPERTGAVVGLFAPTQVGKKDACLNPACYRTKLQNQINVRRQQLAKAAKIDVDEVPLIRSWSYSDGDGYFGCESASVLSGTKRGTKAKPCKLAVNAIDLEPDNYGRTVQVCLKASGCKAHWPQEKAHSSKSGTNKQKSREEIAAEKLEAHRARREEIWNAKVAEALRVRVFRKAAENFEKKFRITDVGKNLLQQLVARFWQMSSAGDSNNLNRVVKHLVDEWKTTSDEREGNSIGDARSGVEYFKQFDRNALYRILFLLIHGHKGTIANGNRYAPQNEVIELADEFAVDYAMIDAEVRLELCAKKHKDAHQTYLKLVQGNSKDAIRPKLFSEKWQVTD